MQLYLVIDYALSLLFLSRLSMKQKRMQVQKWLWEIFSLPDFLWPFFHSRTFFHFSLQTLFSLHAQQIENKRDCSWSVKSGRLVHSKEIKILNSAAIQLMHSIVSNKNFKCLTYISRSNNSNFGNIYKAGKQTQFQQN